MSWFLEDMLKEVDEEAKRDDMEVKELNKVEETVNRIQEQARKLLHNKLNAPKQWQQNAAGSSQPRVQKKKKSNK